jgi:HTH-type transcriptional regulator/antitoxin HipB
VWIRTADDIAQLVRERRKQLGLSQAELARRAGVSRQWIVDLEHGKPTAEVSLVLKTVAAAGLHLDAFDPHQRVGSSAQGTGGRLFDAANEVLEQHRPAGMRLRTLTTRPPRSPVAKKKSAPGSPARAEDLEEGREP